MKIRTPEPWFKGSSSPVTYFIGEVRSMSNLLYGEPVVSIGLKQSTAQRLREENRLLIKNYEGIHKNKFRFNGVTIIAPNGFKWR